MNIKALGTIATFLEARITEDEAQAAKHLTALSSHGLGDCGLRILAECAAKRDLCNLHSLGSYRGQVTCNECGDWWDGSPVDYPCQTVKILTFVYKDHPDYQQEWAPDAV